MVVRDLSSCSIREEIECYARNTIIKKLNIPFGSMSDNSIKVTIDFNDPNLEPEERDEQVQGLIAELRDLDAVETVDRVVDPHQPEGTKSIAGFLIGLLTAEVNIPNAKKLMGFLGDRLGGKSIEFTVEVDGKKLSAKASSREELDYAIEAANVFIEKWRK